MTAVDGRTAPPRIVVMGVSAAGKTSVGVAIAARLEVDFQDADDLHPSANRDKMSAGIPLTDADRGPWLDRVGRALAAAPGLVMACSALRRSYRDRLRAVAPDAVFVHLTGPPALLAARARARTGHFMPPALLVSQLETLEPLAPDEGGVVLDVTASVDDLAESAVRWVLASRAPDAPPGPVRSAPPT
ncbi:gluconokinase [Microbacterium awajiense]|uniref:Gluconokinase n=1 Tax=Microbacterium awajiense TaxID=415214 RepID=A0ABP7ANI6_9MICO